MVIGVFMMTMTMTMKIEYISDENENVWVKQAIFIKKNRKNQSNYIFVNKRKMNFLSYFFVWQQF